MIHLNHRKNFLKSMGMLALNPLILECAHLSSPKEEATSHPQMHYATSAGIHDEQNQRQRVAFFSKLWQRPV